MIDLIEQREGSKISQYPGAVEWLLENGMAHVSRGTDSYILSVLSGNTAQRIGSLNASEGLLEQDKKALIQRGIRWLEIDNKRHWIGH